MKPLKPQGSREAANSWWSVELGEGRTRQIREMFFRVGHPVQKLRRVAIGRLQDARLPLGEVRELHQAEIDGLMGRAKELPRRPKPRRRGPAR